MTALRCPRAWEAEAVTDGRLAGDTAAAFQRHAATCRDCRREVAALTQLTRLARSSTVVEVPPLERRRQRVALLRRANDDLLSPRSSLRRWPILVVAAIVVVAFAAFARPSRPAVGEGVTGARIVADADVLRLAATECAEAAEPAAPLAIVVATPSPTMVTSSPRVVAAATLPPSATTAPDEKIAVAGSVDVGAVFVAAMEAFHEERYADASTLFVSFLDHAKGDARCEDAAFLRAVARARSGDREGSRALMKAYLDGYPNGLRRAEAERFANSLAP